MESARLCTGTEDLLHFVIEQHESALVNFKLQNDVDSFAAVNDRRALREAMRQVEMSTRKQSALFDKLVTELDQRLKKKPFFFRRQHEETIRTFVKLV